MPTTNQLILGAQQRLPKKRMRDKKTPALQGSPQKRGVCLRVYTKTPKKIQEKSGMILEKYYLSKSETQKNRKNVDHLCTHFFELLKF